MAHTEHTIGPKPEQRDLSPGESEGYGSSTTPNSGQLVGPADGDTLEPRVRRLIASGLHTEALEVLGSSWGGFITTRELEGLAEETGNAGYEGGAVAVETDAVSGLLRVVAERPELAAVLGDGEKRE